MPIRNQTTFPNSRIWPRSSAIRPNPRRSSVLDHPCLWKGGVSLIGWLSTAAALTGSALPAFDFVVKATFQTAAHPRKSVETHSQILKLHGTYTDGLELLQEESRAILAQSTAAQASNQLGLISSPDLSHLDASPKLSCQVLDQLSEIDTLVRGEIQDDSTIVENALDS